MMMMMSRRRGWFVVGVGGSGGFVPERERRGKSELVGTKRADKAKPKQTRRASDGSIDTTYIHLAFCLFFIPTDPCTRPSIYTQGVTSLIAQSIQSNPPPPPTPSPHFVLVMDHPSLRPCTCVCCFPFSPWINHCVCVASLGRQTRRPSLMAHPSVIGPVCSFGRRVSQNPVSLAGGTSGKSKTLCVL
jgi:hypothetical protein